ncbi:MAG: hypothetical protein ACFFDI_20465 [Promethearchaeota archaeon]
MIEDIQITNFGKFKEPAFFDLKRKNTFIIGPNGIGKSNLFFCLKMLFTRHKKKYDYSLLMSPGRNADIVVRLHPIKRIQQKFLDDDGLLKLKLTITRKGSDADLTYYYYNTIRKEFVNLTAKDWKYLRNNIDLPDDPNFVFVEFDSMILELIQNKPQENLNIVEKFFDLTEIKANIIKADALRTNNNMEIKNQKLELKEMKLRINELETKRNILKETIERKNRYNKYSDMMKIYPYFKLEMEIDVLKEQQKGFESELKDVSEEQKEIEQDISYRIRQLNELKERFKQLTEKLEVYHRKESKIARNIFHFGGRYRERLKVQKSIIEIQQESGSSNGPLEILYDEGVTIQKSYKKEIIELKLDSKSVEEALSKLKLQKDNVEEKIRETKKEIESQKRKAEKIVSQKDEIIKNIEEIEIKKRNARGQQLNLARKYKSLVVKFTVNDFKDKSDGYIKSRLEEIEETLKSNELTEDLEQQLEKYQSNLKIETSLYSDAKDRLILLLRNHDDYEKKYEELKDTYLPELESILSLLNEEFNRALRYIGAEGKIIPYGFDARDYDPQSLSIGFQARFGKGNIFRELNKWSTGERKILGFCLVVSFLNALRRKRQFPKSRFLILDDIFASMDPMLMSNVFEIVYSLMDVEQAIFLFNRPIENKYVQKYIQLWLYNEKGKKVTQEDVSKIEGVVVPHEMIIKGITKQKKLEGII